VPWIQKGGKRRYIKYRDGDAKAVISKYTFTASRLLFVSPLAKK
jgi:hypothetical protein